MLTQRLGQNLDGNPKYLLLEITEEGVKIMDKGDLCDITLRLANRIYYTSRKGKGIIKIQNFKGIDTIAKRLNLKDKDENSYIASPVPNEELKVFNRELSGALYALMVTE